MQQRARRRPMRSARLAHGRRRSAPAHRRARSAAFWRRWYPAHRPQRPCVRYGTRRAIATRRLRIALASPGSLSPVAPSLRVDARPAPAGRPVCGYATGTDLLVFDRAGTFDHFTVSSVAGIRRCCGRTVRTRRRPTRRGVCDGRRKRTSTGSTPRIASCVITTAINPTCRSLTTWLTCASGSARLPPAQQSRRRASPAASTTRRRPLPMPVLAADGGSLAPLPFRSSPMVHGAARAPTADADLLRVRKVRVTLRVGGAGCLPRIGPAFAVPGPHATRERAADLTVRIDVAPRVLTGGR